MAPRTIHYAATDDLGGRRGDPAALGDLPLADLPELDAVLEVGEQP